MSDNKQGLAEALKKEVKKASSNVSTKVEAEKGDHKIVLTASEITQLYKNETVGRIAVAELSDDLINLINSDPGDAAQEMLTEFRKSFDTNSISKTAKEETLVKEAAHATQDSSTPQMITQKQFDDQKPPLHPRQDEHYTNITQKQLPEHGQRPGTYSEITQGQFTNERDTFYGVSRVSGDWRSEDRNVVTERQFEDGVSTHSEVATNDRGEMGSKYDGDLDAQHKQIGEKQLGELLKHHEWTEPLTVTEGKEQLGGQDGELSRLTAEVANNIIKEAMEALGKTVISAGVTPDKLVSLVKRLVSHESKYAALASTIHLYSGLPTEAIDQKVANARYFGKTANTNKDYSPFLIADVFVRQLAKMAYSPNFIVEGLRALAEDNTLETRIDESANTVLANTQTPAEESTNLDVFKQALSTDVEADCKVEGDADDGMYSYVGAVKEINADPNDKDAFISAATEYARTKIATQLDKEVDLQPQQIDVKADQFEMIFKDASFKDTELEARASKRREMAKEASSKTAQMGGAGGQAPAAGPEMANPSAPPGGADMAAPPPGEALSQEPPMDDMGDDMASGEPKPPGAVCPVCGGEDVDVDNGEFRCQNCGGEGTIHVNLDVTKWPDTIIESEEGGPEGGFGLGEEDLGMGAEEAGMEGMEGGAGTTLPNVPVGASVRVTPFMLEKLSAQNIKIASVCPNCGGHNTDLAKVANSNGLSGICYDCYQEFNFRLKGNKDKKQVFAQYAWVQKSASSGCPGCSRNPLKKAFTESLQNYGMSWDDFDNLSSMKEKGDAILKMAKSGTLDIKEAMSVQLPMDKYAASARWQGYNKFDKFPSASCRERLNRRFGENSTAMSGPCQGAKLADCVCNQLETLGIYTDGLAAKVASVQNSKDPMISNPIKECVAMFVKNDYDVSDACTACDGLRAAYADMEELVVEAIAQIAPKPMQMSPKPMRAAPAPMKPMMEVPVEAKPMSAGEMGGGMAGGLAGAAIGGPAGAAIGGAAGGMVGDALPGVGGDKEMPKPLDEPVDDMMDDGMMDDGMGGMDEGFGDMEESGTVTIKMPAELADSLAEIGTLIDQALGGGLGDDMFEDDLNMEEVTDGVVDDNGGDMEEEGMETEDIPGLADEEEVDSPDMIKESEPEDEMAAPMEAKEMEAPQEIQNAQPSQTPQVEIENEQRQVAIDTQKPRVEVAVAAESKEETVEANVETDDSIKTAKAKELDSLLYSMKSGTIKTTRDSLDSVLDGLLRQATLAANTKIAAKTDGDIKKMERKPATEGDKIKATPAQDAGDFGKVKDGGTMGNEDKFTDGVASKPDVPRKSATMGDEGPECTVSESADLPTVPHGSPAMAGEEHYRPEKGNVVDGNQGKGVGTSASSKDKVKTAGCSCGKGCGCEGNCGDDCKCGCKGDTCGKDCNADTDAEVKTAGCECGPDCSCDGCCEGCKCKGKDCRKPLESCSETNMKKYKVASDHKHYNAFKSKINEGTIKLEDGNTYTMSMDEDKNIILAQNLGEIKKESQTVSPKNVKDLKDDPDLNPSSGAGAGKTYGDEAHSLGVDEKKPSEGMSEADVPEAPNGGRLGREHTVEKATDGPEVPSGGGMNPDYDQNEKNTPEKTDQVLGKENDIAAMASHDEAIKIAGQLLKANMISTDELPKKVAELSSASPQILEDYKNLLNRQADTKPKGMQKEMSSNAVETPILQKTAEVANNPQSDLKDNIQSLFKLDERNRDHERHSGMKGNLGLFR